MLVRRGAILVAVLVDLIAQANAVAGDPPATPARNKRPAVVLTDEARRIHRAALVIDGHNDLPWIIRTKGDSSFDKIDISKPQKDMHTDIPRLRAGGVGAQFWSAYVPARTAVTGDAAKSVVEQIDLIHRLVARYPETFEIARTADDIERIHKAGKIASMIGIEGGHAIENSLELLRRFHRQGAQYMTLTHSDTLDWADSATDAPRSGGLSPFGEEVVRTMNELGMLVDISHVSAETMRDVLRVTKAPIIASHSSAFAIAHHPRNVPDDVLREMPKNGGVIMVNFSPGFIVPQRAEIGARAVAERIERRKKDPTAVDLRSVLAATREEDKFPLGDVHTVVDHIDHIVQVAGVDHVGLGSDYDGITKVPVQLVDVSCYPYITQELLNRGYSEEDIDKILGRNLLRAMRQVEQVAAKLKKHQ
jgi:membrane dipeptidase